MSISHVQLKNTSMQKGSFKGTDKQMNNKFKMKEFKTKSKCTYYLLGKEPVKQLEMICDSCDVTAPICVACYDTCHKNCIKKTKSDYEFKEYPFTCTCGVRKHFVNSKAKKGKVHCPLTELDKKQTILINIGVKIAN